MHVTFDRFEFDLERRALLENGAPVALSPKAFRLLQVLLERAPRALSKQELTESVWPQTFVEESNLASLVAELRTALGDSARNPRFVRTVHGFGYSFQMEVTPVTAREPAALIVYDGEEIPLFEGNNILGRDRATAEIVIEHATVSRRHACIVVGGEGVMIHDLDSKNGTFVDDVRLGGAVPLEDGATFVLGDARIVFRRRAASPSTITLWKPRGRTQRT